MWRRGSGLTLRRLWVLIQGLPADGMFWPSYHRALEASAEPVKATAEQIRERQAYYDGL